MPGPFGFGTAVAFAVEPTAPGEPKTLSTMPATEASTVWTNSFLILIDIMMMQIIMTTLTNNMKMSRIIIAGPSSVAPPFGISLWPIVVSTISPSDMISIVTRLNSTIEPKISMMSISVSMTVRMIALSEPSAAVNADMTSLNDRLMLLIMIAMK